MSYQTSASAAAFIQSHLDLDLELVAQQQGTDAIQPVLPSGCQDGLLPVPSEQRTYKCAGGPSVANPYPSIVTDPSDRFMILQVVAVWDVSLPLEQRLRALVGDQGGELSSSTQRSLRANQPNSDSSNSDHEGDGSAAAEPSVADSVLQASEAADELRRRQRKRTINSRRRWLSLVLTDGFTRVLAVEARPPAASPIPQANSRQSALLPEGVALGAKLKVRLAPVPAQTDDGEAPAPPLWLPAHAHGVLRLHKENTVLMGGSVAALEVYWARWASAQLALMSGRPQKVQQQQQEEEEAPQQEAGNDGSSLSGGTAAPQGGQQPSPPPVVSAQAGQPFQQQQPAASPALPDMVAHAVHHYHHHSPSQQPQPETLSSLPCLPLNRWPSRPPHPQGLFLTRAVIVEVVSDLLINECEPSSARGGVDRGEAEDTCVYSLTVSLGSLDDEASGGSGAGSGFFLHVDLGHAWLRQLVGMPASEFRMFSQSQVPQEVEQLQSIIDRVGGVLEGLGEAFFYLRQRPTDHVVEVVKVEPVVGGGYVQQQQQQQQQ